MSLSNDRPTIRHEADDQRRLVAIRQLDAVCDDYEQALDGTDPPPFHGFLERVDARLRPQLVRELTEIASERLRASGIDAPQARLEEVNAGMPADLMSCLRACFSGAGTVQYEPPVGGAIVEKLGSTRRKPSRGLLLRCPHCSNHVELISDAPLDAVDCSTCGSRFSLDDRSRETRSAETLQQIDRFELIARLGVGGFGTVWKARDTELDRAVAVKIPRHGQLSSEEVEQFLREARSAAQLMHPNIVPVHDVGRENGVVFIVSDLVRGASLSDHLTAQRPSPVDSAELCLTIADALDHAHQRGVIHRDLKPSNVMIDERGTPYLMDFGLATYEADKVTMTTDGQIIGTPAYMSPEQASGRSSWADQRADIYSLGVMLFELLTGELPFRGNAQMQVQQRLTDDAPGVRSLNRHVPIDLATITAKCLERDPGRRYPTARSVAEELRRFLDRKPIKARPLSRIQRAVRWAERNPSQAVAALLVVTMAIIGPAVALFIESQRSRLADLVEEKDSLIELRGEEASTFKRENEALRQELAGWQGERNPWAMWPPRADSPPKQRLLASLREHRAAALERATEGESERTAAMRQLALGLLWESAEKEEKAASHFRAAIPALKRLRAAAPRSLPIATALLQAYDHLAKLSAEDHKLSAEYIEASRSLAEEVATEAPDDALAQAESLDRELRSAVVLGFDSATRQLEEAAAAERRLSGLWPVSPQELYGLACRLAGEPGPLLAVPDGDRGAASTRATD